MFFETEYSNRVHFFKHPVNESDLFCHWGNSNSQLLGYKPSALAIELNSSKVSAGKWLSLLMSLIT